MPIHLYGLGKQRCKVSQLGGWQPNFWGPLFIYLYDPTYMCLVYFCPVEVLTWTSDTLSNFRLLDYWSASKRSHQRLRLSTWLLCLILSVIRWLIFLLLNIMALGSWHEKLTDACIIFFRLSHLLWMPKHKDLKNHHRKPLVFNRLLLHWIWSAR